MDTKDWCFNAVHVLCFGVQNHVREERKEDKLPGQVLIWFKRALTRMRDCEAEIDVLKLGQKEVDALADKDLIAMGRAVAAAHPRPAEKEGVRLMVGGHTHRSFAAVMQRR